jgi:hypothetical protein
VDLRRFVDDLDELILIELFDESDTSSATPMGSLKVHFQSYQRGSDQRYWLAHACSVVQP